MDENILENTEMKFWIFITLFPSNESVDNFFKGYKGDILS